MSCVEIGIERADEDSHISISASGRDALVAGRSGLWIVDLDSDNSQIPRFLNPNIHRHSSRSCVRAAWNRFAEKQQLIASCFDRSLAIWDVSMPDSSVISREFLAHQRTITDVKWSHFHASLLGSCGMDSFLHCWDLRSDRKLAVSFSGWGEACSSLAFNYKNEHIVASTSGASAYIWDKRKHCVPLACFQNEDSQAEFSGIEWSRVSEDVLILKSKDGTATIRSAFYPEQVPISLSYPENGRLGFTPYANGIMVAGDHELKFSHFGSLDSGFRSILIGHAINDFEWRPVYYVSDLPDASCDYQLVTWGSDKTLRIRSFDQDFFLALDHHQPPLTDRQRESKVSFQKSPAEPRHLARNRFDLFFKERHFDKIKLVKHRDHAAKFLKNKYADLLKYNSEEDDEDELLVEASVAIEENFIKNEKFNVPMPRLVGACFAGDKLVVFRQCVIGKQNPSLQVEKVIRRLSGAKFTKSRSNHFMDYIEPEPSLSGSDPGNLNVKHVAGSASPSRTSYQRPSLNQITVFDTSFMMPYSKVLGEKLRLGLDSQSSFCRENAKAAAAQGFEDCRKAWSMAELILQEAQISNSKDVKLVKPLKHRVLKRPVPLTETGRGKINWGTNPLCRKLIDGMFSHFEKNGNVQMLASLSCAFETSTTTKVAAQTVATPTPEFLSVFEGPPVAARSYSYDREAFGNMPTRSLFAESPKAELRTITAANSDIAEPPEVTSSAASLLSQLKSMAFSSPTQSVEVPDIAPASISSKLNSPETKLTSDHESGGDNRSPILALTGIPRALKASMSRLSPARSDILSPVMRKKIHPKLNQLGNTSVEDMFDDLVSLPFLDQSRQSAYQSYRHAYRDILYQWGMLVKAAGVAKFMAPEVVSTTRSKDSVRYCEKCKNRVNDDYCVNCSMFLTKCIICNLPIKGAATFCNVCGHGGHVACIKRWLCASQECPAGCGCFCFSGHNDELDSE